VISAEQAQQFLSESLGISVASFLLDAAIAKVAAAESAMEEAGYSAPDRVIIQTYAVAIIAGTAARQIASQSAPSGASRSFKYADKALAALRAALAALDTAGTVTDIVGVELSAPALFMVVC
jgi:hypothetical protein